MQLFWMCSGYHGNWALPISWQPHLLHKTPTFQMQNSEIMWHLKLFCLFQWKVNFISFLLIYNTYTKHFWCSRNFRINRAICATKKLHIIGCVAIIYTWPIIQLHLFTIIWFTIKSLLECTISSLACVVHAKTWSCTQSYSAISTPVARLLWTNLALPPFHYACFIGW